MADRKRRLIEYGIMVILGIAIAVIMVYIAARSNLNINETYDPDMTVIDNPLMGIAPDATNEAQCEKAKLVYITLTWREWEPREGEFAIDAIEEKYHIARWKQENKHAVIRFVCDEPGEDYHVDIPYWLYHRLDSGDYYDNEYGRGFSPDYADAAFKEYHARALTALAQYCNKDNFVAFVELGSLGHGGSWSAFDNEGNSVMPPASVIYEYANLYSDSFSVPYLLAERNFDFIRENGIGLYNDYLGDLDNTNLWLDIISNDGSMETSVDNIALLPVTREGKMMPVGGDFVHTTDCEELFGNNLGDILSTVTSTNMTYIGPNVPRLDDESLAANVESVVRRMGYRIYPSALKTRYDFANNILDTEITFANAGSAGFFFDWPVSLYIYDKDLQPVFWEGLQLDLTLLNEESEISAVSEVPLVDEIRDEFYIGVVISDYDGKDHINLAIDEEDTDIEYVDDVTLIYHYIRDEEK